MKKQQVVNPKTTSNGSLEKTELLHILGGRPILSESPLNFTEAKCENGCRKACKDGCKSTAKNESRTRAEYIFGISPG